MNNKLDLLIQVILADYDDKTKIIDRIFCFIENDRKHLKEYFDFLAYNSYSLQYVNSYIAKSIAKHYDLKAINTESVPESRLIQSFSELA